MMSSYRAMSGRSDGSAWFDNMDGVALPQSWKGVLRANQQVNEIPQETFASITDGTSNTVVAAEYHTRTHINRGTFWAYTYTSYSQSSALPQTRTLIPDYDACVAIGGAGDSNACKRGWGSFHTGGMNALNADGSVRFLRQTIDINIWIALGTMQNGEVIPGN
jgi:hypothetical protein